MDYVNTSTARQSLADLSLSDYPLAFRSYTQKPETTVDPLKSLCRALLALSYRDLMTFAMALDNTSAGTGTPDQLISVAEKVLAE